MTKIVLALCLLAILLPLLWWVDYSFYNPARGRWVPGRDEVAKDPHEREMLFVRVTAADVTRFGGSPTLAQMSRFYGTDDSLPCTVRQTLKTDNLAGRNRPLRVGTLITLCLN